MNSAPKLTSRTTKRRQALAPNLPHTLRPPQSPNCHHEGNLASELASPSSTRATTITTINGHMIPGNATQLAEVLDRDGQQSGGSNKTWPERKAVEPNMGAKIPTVGLISEMNRIFAHLVVVICDGKMVPDTRQHVPLPHYWKQFSQRWREWGGSDCYQNSPGWGKGGWHDHSVSSSSWRHR